MPKTTYSVTQALLASPAAQKAIEDHRAGRTKFVPLSALDDVHVSRA